MATTFRTSRRFEFTAAAIFEAIQQGERLARWWGPEGFTNQFEVFEFQEGGRWQFTMTGPDGTRYPNESRFVQLVPAQQVTLDHVCAPHFQLQISLEPDADGTLLHWTQTFADDAVAQSIRHIVEPANEQNLDRLQAELSRAKA